MPDEDRLPRLPNLDASTRDSLMRDLNELARLISTETISPEILARIGALAALLPAMRAPAPSSMCDNGDQGPARSGKSGSATRST